MFQWLRLSTSNGRGMGSIPGQGTKIPHATWHSKKKKFTTTKKKQNTLNSLPMETGRKKTRKGKRYKTEEKAKRRRYKTPTTPVGCRLHSEFSLPCRPHSEFHVNRKSQTPGRRANHPSLTRMWPKSHLNTLILFSYGSPLNLIAAVH